MNEEARKIYKDLSPSLDELRARFKEFPEPDPCDKCGRVIFCGVATACGDPECGLMKIK